MSVDASGRRLGEQRGVGITIVLFIVTFGIYGLYWIYKSFAEIRGYRGQGVDGLVGLLLAFVAVSTFLLPSYVGRMFKEDEQQPPITGWGGLWVFIPLIGSIIWLVKIQGALNRFWAQHAGASVPGAAAPVAAPASPAPPPPPPAPQAAASQQVAPPPPVPAPPAPAPPPAAPSAAHPDIPLEAPPPELIVDAPPRPGGSQQAPAPPEPAVPQQDIPVAAAGLATPVLVFSDGPLAGRRVVVEPQLTLGREGADVVVEDPEVSRRHAQMSWSQGRLELSDLRSSNGTFVNGRRIDAPYQLTNGDVVRIGQTSIMVEVPPPRDPNATVLRPR